MTGNSSGGSQYSPAALAYLGDSVYELYVREYLVTSRSSQPSVEALNYVTAHIQSNAVEKLLPVLTEEEESVYRRGRNLGHTNIPKSSTASEYRRATGFEALFGYLYLCGRHERIKELFDLALESADDPEKDNSED